MKATLVVLVIAALMISAVSFAFAAAPLVSSPNVIVLADTDQSTCRPPVPAYASKNLATKFQERGFQVIWGDGAKAAFANAGITKSPAEMTLADAAVVAKANNAAVFVEHSKVHGVWTWPGGVSANGEVTNAIGVDSMGNEILSTSVEDEKGPSDEQVVARSALAVGGALFATKIATVAVHRTVLFRCHHHLHKMIFSHASGSAVFCGFLAVALATLPAETRWHAEERVIDKINDQIVDKLFPKS